jgi:hypothetical protein
MTAISATHVRDNVVTGVSAVQRAAKASNTGWETLTSRQVFRCCTKLSHSLYSVCSQLQDWYSPDSSDLFSKSALEFELSSGGVIVEATE